MELDLENTYVTSDLHLWHKNIIKYCNRPYELTDEGIAKMNEDLLQQIDALPEGSLLINNGDLFMGKVGTSEVKTAVQRMKQNNKKLWLIMGNHDRAFKRYLDPKGSRTSYEICVDLGFDFVSPVPILIEGKYIFSHEPVILSENDNFINVHGHTHDNDCDWECPEICNMKHKYINVCWDKIHKIPSLEELFDSL